MVCEAVVISRYVLRTSPFIHPLSLESKLRTNQSTTRLTLKADPSPPPPLLPLLPTLTGTILDLGPGTGAHLVHLNPSKITHVYGLEPCVALHDTLWENAEKAGLGGKYTVVGRGVEEVLGMEGEEGKEGEKRILSGLEKYGIKEGEVDTILAVRVLCCVPDLKPVAHGLRQTLRPNTGQILFFEHIRARSFFPRLLQGK